MRDLRENERDEMGKTSSLGTATSVAAWAGSDSIKDKRGFEFLREFLVNPPKRVNARMNTERDTIKMLI